MKKVIFLTALFSIHFVANAQMKFGLKVSPHYTWTATDNKNTKSNGGRVNASYGLMGDYYFSDNYALASEIAITTFGVNLSLPASQYTGVWYTNKLYPANNKDLMYNYKMEYIQVPLILRMRTKEIGYLRYYAEFGVGAGFLFRAKADIDFDGESLHNVTVNDPDAADKFDILNVRYSDRIRTLRTYMIFGAGIQYNFFGNSLLVAGLRYDNGLNRFTKDERWDTSLNFIALHAGVLF